MSDFTHRAFVSVEDGIKPPEDYAPARKVRVELTADASNLSDLAGVAENLSRLADQQVNALLGRGPGEQKPATRKRRTQAEIAADLADKTGASAAGPSDPTDLPQEPASPQTAASSGGEAGSTTTAADPTALEDDGLPQSSSTGTSAEPDRSPAPADDPFTIEPEPEPPKVDTASQLTPISDGDLNSAVQQKNAALGSQDGTKAIRSLIAEYNPDPSKTFQLREIPADRRAEFLNRLNALKGPDDQK